MPSNKSLLTGIAMSLAILGLVPSARASVQGHVEHPTGATHSTAAQVDQQSELSAEATLDIGHVDIE